MAERFADEGMSVVLADIDEDGVEAAASEIMLRGRSAVGVHTDVSSLDSVEELRDRAVEAFGTAHLVCLNAGVGGSGELAWEVPATVWEWLLRVNLLGVVNGVRAFVPLLVEQGEGHVVVTSSMAGLVAGCGSTPYTTAKFAVTGLAEALSLELEMIASPVKVSVLVPGPVATRIGELSRHWPADLGPMPQRRLDDRVGALPVPPALAQALEAKMEPSEVAEIVLDAVREDRFWIYTHPKEVADMVSRRADEMLHPGSSGDGLAR
jgi:NAD(P)-dependent dehydrogenase (short-subunit alcohol dehydrogenase family)